MGAGGCRRRALLDHFGDPSPGAPTGRCCDVCDPDAALALPALEAPPARVRARHRVSSPDAAEPTGPPVDGAQFERLKAWRQSRAEGKPAYTVATNAALEEVLRRRPRDEPALLAIRGIGPSFCARHGDSLLAELARLGGPSSPPS
jgi:superfamily II DNA helicase RecQ